MPLLCVYQVVFPNWNGRKELFTLIRCTSPSLELGESEWHHIPSCLFIDKIAKFQLQMCNVNQQSNVT